MARTALGLLRVALLLLTIGVFGAIAVTLTFYLVAQRPEVIEVAPGQVIREQEDFAPRFERWVSGLWDSGFGNWGKSRSVDSVNKELQPRLPVTLRIGATAWIAGWLGGLAIAWALVAKAKSALTPLRELINPLFSAIPSLPIVLLAFVLLHRHTGSGTWAAEATGAALLTLLLLPTSTTLWANALQRAENREYVRVARAKGIHPWFLWCRHVIPNAIAASGVLTQAAFSLASLLVGSVFIEKTFSLGGIATSFVEATQLGRCELAATACVVYFLPLAVGVAVAELAVVFIDPKQVTHAA